MGYLIRSLTATVITYRMTILSTRFTLIKGSPPLVSISIGESGKVLSGFPSRPLESLLATLPRIENQTQKIQASNRLCGCLSPKRINLKREN
jgi:hypothetical protein